MKQKNEEVQKLKREQLLALDIATHCGYHMTHESGTVDFTESMRRNNCKQHKAFRDWLISVITQYGIKQVVAEDVRAGCSKGGFTVSVKLAEFRGILMEVCDTLNLPAPAFINPLVLKKWATGNGRADKDEMVEYCISRWGVKPVDDNEADAIHLFMYYARINNL